MHSTLPRHIKADILKALVLTGMIVASTGMIATSTGGNTQVVAVGGWGCLFPCYLIVPHVTKFCKYIAPLNPAARQYR